MKYLQDAIDNLQPTFETAMPPSDAKKWLQDSLYDLEEYGDIKNVDDIKISWEMVDAFTDIVDKIPEDAEDKWGRQKLDDAIIDAAEEVYHQFVGSVARKEKEVKEGVADWLVTKLDMAAVKQWKKAMEQGGSVALVASQMKPKDVASIRRYLNSNRDPQIEKLYNMTKNDPNESDEWSSI
jgi:hypothetical protein